MSCWDELCIISGVAPRSTSNGFELPIPDSEELRTIAGEIQLHLGTKYGPSSILSTHELTSIVKKAFQATHQYFMREDECQERFREEYEWGVEAGLLRGNTWDTFIAIGLFDNADYEFRFNHTQRGGRPHRDKVEVRKLSGCSQSMEFEYRLVIDENGVEKRVRGDTDCSIRHNAGIITASYHCYQYFEPWLDLGSLSDRAVAFPEDQDPVPFYKEFYEISLTQDEPRGERSAVLPCIDYGGIEKTLDQNQNCFVRFGSQFLAEGIHRGERGKKLMRAILWDYKAWQIVRPDIWPKQNEFAVESELLDVKTRQIHTSPLYRLPLEILTAILVRLPLSSILTFASSCSGFYVFLSPKNPQLWHSILRLLITHPQGDLHWILPVPTRPQDELQMKEALMTWDDQTNKSTMSSQSILFSSTFPLTDFVQSCYESFSMRNRRRLWLIAQQYRELWRHYRTRGWNVDVFK